MKMGAFIILIVCCLLLILYWCIAAEFEKIAAAKGFPQKKYFWWCFWCTFFGYLMVIALPDHSGAKSVVEVDELPDL